MSRFTRLKNRSLSRQRIQQQAILAARTAAPLMLAFAVSSVAHAQGSLDMSGATSVMNTFKTFALYAGAVICLGSLIFAGIRMMGGRFQDAIPGLFGALFGAGVLGWGAGWISSLTGQSVTQ
ncbi:MAG: TrbC/VirB2 family protein [Janthinobacterium lividum]